MATSNLADAANNLPTAFGVDSVLQPICMTVELSLKAALVRNGADPNSSRGPSGHDLGKLADRLAVQSPHCDDARVRASIACRLCRRSLQAGRHHVSGCRGAGGAVRRRLERAPFQRPISPPNWKGWLPPDRSCFPRDMRNGTPPSAAVPCAGTCARHAPSALFFPIRRDAAACARSRSASSASVAKARAPRRRYNVMSCGPSSPRILCARSRNAPYNMARSSSVATTRPAFCTSPPSSIKCRVRSRLATTQSLVSVRARAASSRFRACLSRRAARSTAARAPRGTSPCLPK
jgi:hypothetical protein